MQIDTKHLHHWMNAIRNSENPKRTLDAFYRGQISSKEWLIKELEKRVTEPVTVEIHGGWVGVLASLMFQSKMSINHITSIDIDNSCKEIAEEMNRLELIEGRFSALTKDMCECVPSSDLIINTSCEHIDQTQYDIWLNKIPKDRLIILQSNNYNISEHVRLADNIDIFVQQSKLSNILFQGLLELPLYNRFMIIGYQ